ncbi:uncharacterized protein LOC130703854 [Daphnia carinata]|uniref:uncharacterized protein LOC130703854 n=1 Tax=Daphnia carinata TaxID=120202 RepID=UPI00257956C3|nr:uncharacterized protein LOC130703854 [Daphnia carinata]
MAVRPSIILLFDLDLLSHRSSNNLVNSDDDFRSQCIHLLRHIALNILNYFSEKQINIRWGYRFYSSSNYHLTNKASFVELTAYTVEEFEEALNVRFEQNNGLTDGACFSQMTGACVLSRTLQDIISDYDWKAPSDSLTPTRKGKKAGKQLEQGLQNLVFIFTEVPADEGIRSFCKFSVQDELSTKSITNAILPKELAKRFQEFQLSLNFIDFSNNMKTMFRKIANNLRGAVLNAQFLISPFSFSQILQASCFTEDDPPKECHFCQSLSLGSKIIVFVLNQEPIKFQVQCWNPGCIKSSLCLENTINKTVINCKAVQKTSVPVVSFLNYESLFLLTSNSTLVPELCLQKISWIGQLNDRFCCISPLTSRTASMLFPSSDYSTFQLWAASLFENTSQKEPKFSCTRSFAEKLVEDNLSCSSYAEQMTSSITNQDQRRYILSHIKGSYVEKKGTHVGVHWQMLKDCFQNEEIQEEGIKEFNNNSFDQLSLPMPQSDIPGGVSASCNEAALKKIGSNRIQNLRASTLLQKSQEVRAKKDEIEREKIYKEMQVAEEKKEKVWKELQIYLSNLRSSIAFGEDLIRLTPNTENFDQQEILDSCLKLKQQEFTSQLEDWQLLCLVQVIASTILYVFQEKKTLGTGYEIIQQNLLKKPGTVNRTTPKDSKVIEFKFQIMLRLELCWVVPSLIGEEEDMLQETVSLFQMLAIHSNPQIISTFFQDALIHSFENMLPEFLVSLGEELNQPIPSNLSEQVRLKTSIRTPSPALSSKAPSVHSIASLQETNNSQRSVARELRSRTLSRQPSLNVLQHKKQITLPNKMEKVPVPVKKEESNEVVRVRRSLQFGAEIPLQKIRSKSPSKGAYTPRKLNTSFEPLTEFTTPSKAPNAILAPETPSRLRSDNKNKKTDGIHVVGESPEIKHEVLRRSPRRLEAAIALRRRASFYSTLTSELNPEKGASRNWSRGESQVWSEKAKANTSIQPIEDASPQVGQSARFLFSKILSRNDSMPTTELGFSPRTTVAEPEASHLIPSLATPRKGDSAMLLPPSTPSRQRLTFGEPAASSILVQGTPHKTPMKTPKQVQFDFSFQPATPSSKVVPDPRSILKSPMSFQSHQSRTPCKTGPLGRSEHQVIHFLDDTNFTGRHQLELHSPLKPEGNESKKEDKADGFSGDDSRLSHESMLVPFNQREVHKLDENTLRQDQEVELQSPAKAERPSIVSPAKAERPAIVSPLTLRRSSRHPLSYQNNQASNFYQHNPNWSVVNYRRPNVEGTSGVRPPPDFSVLVNNGDTEDPYEFEEETETKSKRLTLVDSSSHKRKLFQSSAEKTPVPKRRRLIPNTSPIEESKTPPCKFQAPKEGSLFHLENSPLLSSIEAKFLA